MIPESKSRQSWVSILLIVELAFEDAMGIDRSDGSKLFQSFLSWNWPLKVYHMPYVYPYQVVSILLIVELAFEGGVASGGFGGDFCFNPSYRGIGLWSALNLILFVYQQKFQSFLSWNWPLKASFFSVDILLRFVSILLIVELAFEALQRSGKAFCVKSFNPSYRGIGLWRMGAMLALFAVPVVSILLIVELAFEVRWR